MTKPIARDPIYRKRVFDPDVIEQDHRAIKRRCASMAGFKSFDNAAITIAGIEPAHRIRNNLSVHDWSADAPEPAGVLHIQIGYVSVSCSRSRP